MKAGRGLFHCYCAARPGLTLLARVLAYGMTKRDKTLERMRANPRDWRFEELVALAESCGCVVRKPKRGSHYYVTHPEWVEHLAIPFARPVKPIYVRKLLALLDGPGKED